MRRFLYAVMALILVWFGLSSSPAAADPTPSPTNGPLSEREALRQAKDSGKPVVVSSLTDERTLVTADPATGLLTAQLTANVARVADGQGGWREPSAILAKGLDGLLRPEAAAAQIAISPGGATTAPLASLSDGSASIQFTWGTPLPAAVVDGPTATYPEVYPGVDLVVRAGLESVETFLVVKSRQASLNPLVREWSMPVAMSTGLATKSLANGAKSIADAKGVERLVLPPALMWDSAGKPASLSRTSDLLSEGVATRVTNVTTVVAGGRMSAKPSVSFLDDPATVYPVVIDPSAELGQTHVLRVTDDWSKWDSEVGDHGKVGYNGWSTPYYRSRMFYQFGWKKNTDGTYVKPAQIVKAEFKYKQDHSPQYSPCNDTTSAYPGVYAKLANVIESSDTWSDRTGSAWHPWPAKLDRLAVGNEDTCNKETWQTWNLTTAVQNERQPRSQGGYDYRTTITVGLFGEDEADKMGWKHYLNNGSSPVFEITYHWAPQVPSASELDVTPKVAASPLTTNSKLPTLRSIVRLESNYTCPTGNVTCLRAEFELTPTGGTPGTVQTVQGNDVATATASEASVATPLSAGTYSLRVRTFSYVTQQTSGWSTASTLKVDPPPAAPTWLWNGKSSWPDPSGLPLNLPLSITATANAADPDVTKFCATVIGANQTQQFCSTTADPSQISIPALTTPGSYTVRVAAVDAYSTGAAAADLPASRTAA